MSIKLLIAMLCITTVSVWAQDDPSAQYAAIVSGAFTNEPNNIEIPVEVGVLRIQFFAQYEQQLNMTLITPLGNPVNLKGANISEANSEGKRSITVWDPMPGKWIMRIDGQGGYSAGAMVQGDLYVCCMQFTSRNGGISVLEGFQPVRGSAHQAQVFSSGYNLESVDFFLIDESGKEISKLKFRQSDYSSPSGYTLHIETPDKPFRIAVRGTDTGGKAYQRVFLLLIRPSTNIPVLAENSPAQINVQPNIEDIFKGAETGERKVIRAHVKNWTDEILYSESGNPIGVRLKYSIEFPLEGIYSPYPQLYPDRMGGGYTGSLSMRPHKGSVEGGGAEPNRNLSTNVRANFKSGVTYNFVLDMVPSYLHYNEQKKQFCFQTKIFNQPGVRERFTREINGDGKIRLRFSIAGTDLDGRSPVHTENSYAPNNWYQSYLKEGIKECK